MSNRFRGFKNLLQWFPRLSALAVAAFLALAAPAIAEDNDDDGYDEAVDCNDADASIHPGAAESCDGVDSDCDGIDIADPDPVDGMNNDGDTLIDEGFGFCEFSTDQACVTPGRYICSGGALACEQVGPTIVFTEESLANGNCHNGINDDCDVSGTTELLDQFDADCPAVPEICDGIDNNYDGSIDNLGQSCSVGAGECMNTGILICDGGSPVCSATADDPKNEGSQFGNSCSNEKDDDCDGFEDDADPGCAALDQELCGNDIDDDFDGQTDEGFPTLGLPCSVGVGECAEPGEYVCSADGTTTVCDATGFQAGDESGDEACTDLKDNDCDGSTDIQDASCSAAYADLGVTCSLPYDRGKPGADCNGWHVVEFGAADEGVESLRADLLALDTDGSLLATIENVQPGDLAHLASRQTPQDFRVDSKTNKQGTRHTVFAPMPLLRVTGTKNGVDDVAYCSILPYLEVTEPDGVTISLSDANEVNVSSFLPLVDVDSLVIRLDGVDIVEALKAAGNIPANPFPTAAGAWCNDPLDPCLVQIEAGCGEMALVPVEISDLRVEGLDTSIAATAKDGTETPEQVNTVSFHLSGLPAGGHVVYIDGDPLPLPKRLSAQCVVDDLTDTGKLSAFGISVDPDIDQDGVIAPLDQEIVAFAPVHVRGKVCGGNEIASLQINGLPVDVSPPAQVCDTVGSGAEERDECYLPFDVPVPEKKFEENPADTIHIGKFKRGSNRVIADASDVLGNRAFNTENIFGLGQVQSPAGATAMALELAAAGAVNSALFDIQMDMTTSIDPAFVVGLDEAAVQKFFNAKCGQAIQQFTDRATTNLQNKAFGTIDIEPGCSCDLIDTPIVLEVLDFEDQNLTDDVPECVVDFQSGQIGITVDLPNIFIQVGVHDTCTDRGLFGECLARTVVNVTAVTKVEDISFAFNITEGQIETKTPPDASAFTYAWTVLDNADRPLFESAGTCAGGAKNGRECFGDPMCKGPDDTVSTDDGTCVGVVKNDDFDPVTSQNAGIECWGGDLCEAFQVIGAVLIEVFTFGLADGFEIVDFLDFDFEFQEDFLTELAASDPDALQIDEIEVDEGTVQEAGHAEFTPGAIDVEIEDGGLTAAFGAEFSVQTTDPTIPTTTGAVLTPAPVPTVAEVIAVGNDVTMLIADDVFAQIFAAMKVSGALQATCNHPADLFVDDLLPADATGGCESIGGDNVAGATLRGICHAIRSARPDALPASNCNALPPETGSNPTLLDNTKRGVCVGFQNGDCSALPTGPKLVCNATPHRDIQATDGVLACARQDMEPDLLIQDEAPGTDGVETQLVLEDLNVVFALDRNGDNGYTGTLESLPNCLAVEANGAGDCKLIASCLDLTITADMSLDSSSCTADEAGFVFDTIQIVGDSSDIDFGVMCGAATGTSDDVALLQSFESQVLDAINQAAEDFMPAICVEGLTLGGVLNFSSDDAQLFGLTTAPPDGVTPGFSDYLGITVPLNDP